jgi:hypothetical protein
LELSKRIGILQSTASQSVKVGEKIVKKGGIELKAWSISINQFLSPSPLESLPCLFDRSGQKGSIGIKVPFSPKGLAFLVYNEYNVI